jgi:type IV secretory pathway TrbL component
MQAFHGFNDDKALMALFFGKPGMAQHMCASLDGYLTCKPSMASMMLSLSWLLLFLQALHGSAHCCN